MDYQHCGAVAQMGERRVRNAEVGSSILLGSPNFPLEYSHIPSPLSSKGCSVSIRYIHPEQVHRAS